MMNSFIFVVGEVKTNQFGNDIIFYVSFLVNGEKISEILMKHGANLTIKSKDGMTPLHRSIQMGMQNF